MLYVLKGHAAPETRDAIERLAALGERSGQLIRLAGSMNTRGFGAYFSGDLATAKALADNALKLAVRDGSPSILANVHFLQIATRELLGDLTGVEEHFAAGFKFFDDPEFRRYPSTAVAAFSAAAFSAWTMGRIELARARSRQAMATANMNNAHEAASAQMYAAGLHAAMREFERAEALASQALTLSEQHQLAYHAAFSRCVLGQAEVRLGRPAEGIALLRRGITGALEIGISSRVAYYTALLAEAEQQQGASADALETIERAFQAEPDAPVFRPEIFRIRGELRVSIGQKDRAEAEFREAIGLARSMAAKAWELRLALSLARLLAQRGRGDEARTMLSEIYNWFSEGFDTPDLKDAKALLDELAA